MGILFRYAVRARHRERHRWGLPQGTGTPRMPASAAGPGGAAAHGASGPGGAARGPSRNGAGDVADVASGGKTPIRQGVGVQRPGCVADARGPRPGRPRGRRRNGPAHRCRCCTERKSRAPATAWHATPGLRHGCTRAAPRPAAGTPAQRPGAPLPVLHRAEKPCSRNGLARNAPVAPRMHAGRAPAGRTGACPPRRPPPTPPRPRRGRSGGRGRAGHGRKRFPRITRLLFCKARVGPAGPVAVAPATAARIRVSPED
jgi:hypothetical protein